MKVNVAELKSAEVITDVERIGEILLKRRTAKRLQDGSVRAYKSAYVSSGSDGAPHVKSSSLRELAKKRGIPWRSGYEQRVVPFWASDERVDKQGDIVVQDWDFSTFSKNPVMPWDHDWHDFPLASALDWKVVERSAPDYKGPALWLMGLFAEKEDNEYSDKALRLIKAGILRGGSAGFASKEVVDVKDENERKALGLERGGLVLGKNELWEFSPTSLPANHGAYTVLASAKRAKLLEPTDIDFVREVARIKTLNEDPDEWTERDRRYIAMGRLLYPDHEFRSVEPDEPIVQEERKLKTYVPGIDPAGPGSGEERMLGIEEALVALSQRVSDLELKLDLVLNEEDAVEEDDSAGGGYEELSRALEAHSKLGKK